MKKFYNRLNFNQIWPWLSQRGAWPCTLCGDRTQVDSTEHAWLCQRCHHLLPWYQRPHCPQCAMPSPAGHLCGRCLQHPPAFDRTLAIFHYGYPLDHLLHQFKYQQQLALGRLLSQLMLQQWPTLSARPDMLVAMPMHCNRLQARGFNHAHELAKDLARHWKIPCSTHACARIKDTPMQAGLDMKTRTRHLRDAFSSSYPFAGQHVAVIDDVMTTGASMHALARVLKRAGAAQVSAIVVARTLRAREDSAHQRE